MEDAEGSLEIVDRDPELGTRSFTAGAFPLSVKFYSKLVSGKPGDRAKPENLLRRRNHSGRMRIGCRQRRTGRHDPCQSKVTFNRNCSAGQNQPIYQVPIQRG